MLERVDAEQTGAERLRSFHRHPRVFCAETTCTADARHGGAQSKASACSLLQVPRRVSFSPAKGVAQREANVPKREGCFYQRAGANGRFNSIHPKAQNRAALDPSRPLPHRQGRASRLQAAERVSPPLPVFVLRSLCLSLLLGPNARRSLPNRMRDALNHPCHDPEAPPDACCLVRSCTSREAKIASALQALSANGCILLHFGDQTHQDFIRSQGATLRYPSALPPASLPSSFSSSAQRPLPRWILDLRQGVDRKGHPNQHSLATYPVFFSLHLQPRPESAS